ncbi:hypothetical protein BGW39_006648 [Mortierella sp. 14UC]|nr:hypothetical protein BGW39_006648 [Mortierella sp. 14UC]
MSRSIYDPLDGNDADTAFDDLRPVPALTTALGQRSIIVEPSMLLFLAERVEPDPDGSFHRQLCNIIEQSKNDEQTKASLAAANAISILVKAESQFIGADLRGIKVSGADLRGGQFDSADLQDADLSIVNLAISPANQELAMARRDNTIELCNIFTAETRIILTGHEGQVHRIAYSLNGTQIATASADTTVRIWSTVSGATLHVLSGHFQTVQGVAFSPTDSQAASCGDDRIVQI